MRLLERMTKDELIVECERLREDNRKIIDLLRLIQLYGDLPDDLKRETTIWT